MVSDSLEKRKGYPARIFNRATVVCPSCLQRFEESARQCQRCGFDAYRVVAQFPFDPPVMELMMDNVGVADDKLRSDLERAVGKVVRKFPQLGFYFCFVEMDDPVKLPEFGFWLMNASLLQDGQVEEDRAWSLLLLIDVKRGLVSFTPGYAIEAFIEDSKWEESIRQISEDLASGDFRSGLLKYVKNADQLLQQTAKDARKKVKL